MSQQQLSEDKKTPGRDNGFIRALGGLNLVLGAIEKWIIIICVLAMALLMSGHVVGNLLFQQGIPGTYEVTEMFIVVITFVGVGYAARHSRHISMTAIYDQLSGRLRKALLIVLCLGTAALMFYFAYKSVDYVVTLQERGRTSAALGIPMWMVYLALPIGFTLAGIQYLLTTARNLVSQDIYRSFTEKEEYDELPEEDPDLSHTDDDNRRDA
ncbi:TRAP transporter small permease [Pistricoccus aurantiacus]|uniref:TRAP transporter small permease protein n=1 Tax=Pistricoccus aurantiacus TaxID=1883414 RepID=A0A5B8SQC2_9GAMM|nr:TRAP transporter small permease [Pistricoccus aurantiacus]QEA38491.1 TRAP transporter small permease [Pistricoccus aurantiacus]